MRVLSWGKGLGWAGLGAGLGGVGRGHKTGRGWDGEADLTFSAGAGSAEFHRLVGLGSFGHKSQEHAPFSPTVPLAFANGRAQVTVDSSASYCSE